MRGSFPLFFAVFTGLWRDFPRVFTLAIPSAGGFCGEEGLERWKNRWKRGYLGVKQAIFSQDPRIWRVFEVDRDARMC